MNIVQAFVDWMEDNSIATLGQDLFISRAPTRKGVANNIWWLKVESASAVSKNVTGEYIRPVTISIYYRNVNPKVVYDELQELQELLECESCLTLEGYTIYEVATTGPFIDEDIESEERTVGLLQVIITDYKDC